MNDLADLLRQGVRSNPEGVAVRDSEHEVTYSELDYLADRWAAALAANGVEQGDRVGIWLPKSIDAVAAMQGTLRIGAAYVPIDPQSPATRARDLLIDSRVSAFVAPQGWEPTLGAALSHVPALLTEGGGEPETWEGVGGCAPTARATPFDPNRLAYILYTSGSTGKPKGVCISHRNALAFIAWALDEIAPTPRDRFSNHAPFHFDLSVLDLYVALWSGARVVLVPESISYVARRLVAFVERERITVWYSVPSALTLMMEQGGLAHANTELRTILFAGEPFPVKHLRRLRAAFPTARMLNLYGPTETNVCTYQEVTDVSDDQTSPPPIGRGCSGDEVWAIKGDGSHAGVGEQGELMVEGDTVMMGYWGREPHDGPYSTGDIVTRLDDETYAYVGRRDSMVKVRGHRVELGEIEATLLSHPNITEAAVLPSGAALSQRLVAFVCFDDDANDIPLLELKGWCADRLPRYMIIHDARPLAELPRTGNGKIDRRALQASLEEEVPA
jgi:L-proline---[L-prolyl-carrier protein] ligase